MLNYTKGKWTSNEITTEQGRRMAGGYKYGLWANTETPTSISSESIAFIKRAADAQLISAAPDMYEALNDTNSLMKTLLFKHPDDAVLTALSSIINKALSKAEGK